MREGIELWTSFVSPSQLNTMFLSREDDELDDLPPVLILVKTKSLGCLPSLSLQNMEDLRILYYPILLNTEGHCLLSLKKREAH